MITRWVGLLIVANIAVFMLQQGNPDIEHMLAFVPYYFLQQPWTAITYMFLHANFGHILFNMLGLFFFGPRVEERLGGTRFLALYFVSGIVGAATSMVLSPHASIIGASAGLFGVEFAFARLWPRAQVLLWGVVPVSARGMIVVMTVMALFGGIGISFSLGNVAHFAHLGGFAGGWLVMRLIGVRTVDDRLRPVQPRRAPTPPAGATERWKQIRLEQLHPVNREEAERVLAKLETRGPHSLTAEEQAFLDRFSAM